MALPRHQVCSCACVHYARKQTAALWHQLCLYLCPLCFMSVYVFDWLNSSSSIHSPLNPKRQHRLQVVRQTRTETGLFMLCPDRLQRETLIFPNTSFVFLCYGCCQCLTPCIAGPPPQVHSPYSSLRWRSGGG